ncbi:NADH dehydrogenase [ubiquinone] 1 alpha subcomplex assembly factor 2 [Exaiptasia diaphana]|uniref:NADH dehydrogenase [ubiquinone] 1 alpha subcomplex assembly factor 2 n=1 Tax=Exaiptasia diaphana TaxID=2652724 RepID=A0A913WXD6_EXADI|nr:NADH dehydrogenase [ubiquinone] 1 alpha subcomplex assembly factor 2 [Exaiptasia diaphana]KXJ17112.1 Mimitin, mitochondrial [Exaiptasia diaphana]
MSWFRNLLNVLRPGRRIVGTDLDGNTYIEVISKRGGRSTVRREVITNLKHEQYEDGSIPVEWEAWIRGKREDPPTHDELIQKMQQREIIKQRAKNLEQEERKKMEEQQEKERTSTSPVGHASSHVYEKSELRSEPTRVGDSFHPGAWTPSQGGSGQAEKIPKTDKNDFEPEGWVPPKRDK